MEQMKMPSNELLLDQLATWIDARAHALTQETDETKNIHYESLECITNTVLCFLVNKNGDIRTINGWWNIVCVCVRL